MGTENLLSVVVSFVVVVDDQKFGAVFIIVMCVYVCVCVRVVCLARGAL
jgi:hypothetical protein